MSDTFMGEETLPYLKFENVGDIRTITVREVTKTIDTFGGEIRTWPNGDPMHVFIFKGESAGEEVNLWVRGNLVKTVKEAVRAAGLTTVVNTKLTIKFDSLGDAPKKGFKQPKLFKVKIETVEPLTADPFTTDDEEPF